MFRIHCLKLLVAVGPLRKLGIYKYLQEVWPAAIGKQNLFWGTKATLPQNELSLDVPCRGGNSR